jgi:hypothetical protein
MLALPKRSSPPGPFAKKGVGFDRLLHQALYCGLLNRQFEVVHSFARLVENLR